MPKLKEVNVKKSSMDWEDVKYTIQKNKVVTTIPKRELLTFLDKGKKVKRITVEFAD